MTTETQLKIDSLRRDLERLRNYVAFDDHEGAKRIKLRMIDTATETITDDTYHDQVMEIIDIVNQIYPEYAS